MKGGTKKLIYKWVLVKYKELCVRWDKKSDGGGLLKPPPPVLRGLKLDLLVEGMNLDEELNCCEGAINNTFRLPPSWGVGIFLQQKPGRS